MPRTMARFKLVWYYFNFFAMTHSIIVIPQQIMCDVLLQVFIFSFGYEFHNLDTCRYKFFFVKNRPFWMLDELMITLKSTKNTYFAR